VQRSQPTEVQARHILITPAVTEVEVDSARARADRILNQVRAGASFDSLQRIYHDGAEEKAVEDVPVGQLPEPYPSVLAEADSGAVVPLELSGQADAHGKFAIIQVTGRNDEGTIRFEDVRDVIRQRLSRDLSLRRYYDRLREHAYLDIRI
jgi:parvulin-like peptidyl-prolyl isomerase